MPTLLCVPITVHDEAAALADASEAQRAGADLVEFRIDEFFSGDEGDFAKVARLASASPLPCIVTCRAAFEGGAYDGDDMARVSLYERLGNPAAASEQPPRFIDCELETYTRSANLKQKVNLAVHADAAASKKRVRPELASSLILSVHDFAGRPGDLSRRLLRLRSEPAASVHKLAFRARSLRDNLELFDILRQADRPTIALGMGEFGLMSRVLAPKFGGFLTFASLRPASATAPGQPTMGELLELFRFRSINPRTRVLGVVGWPVGHSMSPRIHNAAFEHVGADAVYVPLPVAASDDREASFIAFKATLLELIEHDGLDFAGCSVTLPHKENLVRLAREQGWSLDDTSNAVGAANTLVVDRSRPEQLACAVLNTDGPGAMQWIRDTLRRPTVEPGVGPTIGPIAGDEVTHEVGAASRDPVAGQRFAIIGAGGVARVIAYELARAGGVVDVFNRSQDRARELCNVINHALYSGTGPTTGGQTAPCGARSPAVAPVALSAFAESHGRHAFAGVINCTPVGMKGGPDPDGSPISFDDLRGAPSVAFDTVYNPIRTSFLARAELAGWKARDGVGMFVAQGLRQFHAWTRIWSGPKNLDVELHALFDRIVRDALR
ncbi:MAG: type I 3-dehydroquinate dehydratase [Planctomycetota bacterium]|nr:type I 3-dehydroquinate dehydratase [Planctomycetota bacterium]